MTAPDLTREKLAELRALLTRCKAYRAIPDSEDMSAADEHAWDLAESGLERAFARLGPTLLAAAEELQAIRAASAVVTAGVGMLVEQTERPADPEIEAIRGRLELYGEGLMPGVSARDVATLLAALDAARSDASDAYSRLAGAHRSAAEAHESAVCAIRERDAARRHADETQKAAIALRDACMTIRRELTEATAEIERWKVQSTNQHDALEDARAEIERLTKARDRIALSVIRHENAVEDDRTDLAHRLSGALDELGESQADAERLLTALKTYGRHDEACMHSDACACGLDDAFAAALGPGGEK